MKTLTIENDDYVFIENGDLYTGSYQIGPTFTGPTSDAGIRIKAIEGKSVQAVSTGKQLFDASKIPSKTMSGVTLTNNGDGSFTFDMNKTIDTVDYQMFSFTIGHDEMVKLFKAGPVYGTDLGNNIAFFEAGLIGADDLFIYPLKIVSGKMNMESFEITQSELDDPNIKILVWFGANKSVTQTVTLKPMLYQDGDGTYEPYTGGKAGPQPEYPIPIESVKITKLTGPKREETLTNPIVLRSLPDGTKDEYRDGKIIRRVGMGFIDGSGTFSDYDSKTPGFYKLLVRNEKVSKMDVGEDDQLPNFYCDKLLQGNIRNYVTSKVNSDQTERICASKWSGSVILVLKSTRLTNVESAASYLASNPITYYYKLKTPTIEPLNLPILPSSAPSGSAQTDSPIDPTITWEALPAGSCALEVQELRKRIEELESEAVNAQN